MQLSDLRNSVVLQEDVPEPELAELLNLDVGIALLLRHINDGGIIGIHFDVDCDGFSAGIVAYRALKALLPTVHITTNNERTHGVNEDTKEFCWEKRLSLLIIVDSSSRLDYDMGCDVLVLDHHEFDGVSTRLVEGNKQIVVSSKKVDKPEPMSGCEVTYEFFRHLYAQMETPIDSRLAQWVGVSIISDVIDTKTLRNQFYVREAFESNTGIHPDLRRICNDIDSYFRSVHRSYVTYKLAPFINAMSRSGFSKSLIYVISDNETPKLPEWALTKRDEVCAEALKRAKSLGGCVFSNLSGVEDAWRYTGVAAAKLASGTGCAALVFVKDEEGVRGSFRKALSGGNYLSEAKKHLTADGHASAFGFKGTPEGIKEYVRVLSESPPDANIPQLKSSDIEGGRDLQVIAQWNGRVNSDDDVYIMVAPSELVFTRSQGKISFYKWRSAFDVKLLTKEFPQPPRLFAEYQRGIGIYLK